MKGSLFANPTFVPLHILRPTIISINPLVVYDDLRLHFNGESVKWQAKDIVNCAYSQNYQALMVLTDDSKIYVFSNQLELITVLPNWQAKYIVGFQLLESLDIMLLIGTDEIELVKINIVTNLKRTKFLSSMKFGIKKLQKFEVKREFRLKWNKGYGYNINQDLLYIWSLQDMHFFTLSTLKPADKHLNITRKEVAITSALYLPHYKYTATGLLNGDVKVWRMSTSQIYHLPPNIIHTFSYHSKQIDQMIPGADHKTIITLGQDMYVCFMSIQTFEVLRVFNFVGEYSKIFLVDHLKAYAIKDSYLGELNFGQQLQFIAELTGIPTGSQIADKSMLQFTLNSNLGIQLSLDELKREQLNKIQLTYIYPPLKSKNIKEIVSCPYLANTYYMLVEEGELFRVRLQGNQGTIDQHISVQKCSDTQKHPLHQIATTCQFLKILPPMVDAELVEKVGDQKYPLSRQARLDLNKKLKLITVGCNRGSIIFLQVEDPTIVYARVGYHRQKVVKLAQVHNSKGEWMLSFCEQKFLKIVGFQYGRPSCLYSIFCGQIYTSIFSFEAFMVFAMPKGIFQICSFDPQPYFSGNPQAVNHQDEIVSISFDHKSQLLLTAAKDNKIKMWTTRKILIYEIVLEPNLQYAVWARNDVMLVQNNKLCCLRNLGINITLQQIQEINQEFLECNAENPLKLSQLIERQNHRIRQKHFKVKTSKPQSVRESPQKNRIKSLQERQQSRQRKINLSVAITQKSPMIRKKLPKIKTQPIAQEKAEQERDISTVQKHLNELKALKKVTNQSFLPRIKPRTQDLFLDFMRQKLLNKKVVTRRDITLNRIILKNFIKEQAGQSQVFRSLKFQ